MKKLIIATGLLMATSAYAQTEVLTGVTRGKDYGVVYALPKTQIEIEIKANKVNYKPGEFSKYADRYLRLTNVSAEPEEYWELNSETCRCTKQRSYLFRQTERQNRSSSYGTD
jgi:hypothetical protein